MWLLSPDFVMAVLRSMRNVSSRLDCFCIRFRFHILLKSVTSHCGRSRPCALGCLFIARADVFVFSDQKLVGSESLRFISNRICFSVWLCSSDNLRFCADNKNKTPKCKHLRVCLNVSPSSRARSLLLSLRERLTTPT